MRAKRLGWVTKKIVVKYHQYSFSERDLSKQMVEFLDYIISNFEEPQDGYKSLFTESVMS